MRSAASFSIYIFISWMLFGFSSPSLCFMSKSIKRKQCVWLRTGDMSAVLVGDWLYITNK